MSSIISGLFFPVDREAFFRRKERSIHSVILISTIAQAFFAPSTAFILTTILFFSASVHSSDEWQIRKKQDAFLESLLRSIFASIVHAHFSSRIFSSPSFPSPPYLLCLASWLLPYVILSLDRLSLERKQMRSNLQVDVQLSPLAERGSGRASAVSPQQLDFHSPAVQSRTGASAKK